MKPSPKTEHEALGESLDLLSMLYQAVVLNESLPLAVTAMEVHEGKPAEWRRIYKAAERERLVAAMKPDELALIRASGAWWRYENGEWVAMDVDCTVPMGAGATVSEALEALEEARKR